MHKYFFVLGNNHSLSKIEILILLKNSLIDPKIIASSSEILIIETSCEINPNDLINKLGGTIKIGEIIDNFRVEKFFETNEEILTDINLLSKLFDPELDKLTFGISVYNAGSRVSTIQKIYPKVMKSLPKIKHFLQSSYKTNFFKSHERFISSVSVEKNRLLTDGFELVICVGEETVYLGKSLVVQDFADYSFRDYERPERDTKAGMIPPKLAKIMINMSRLDINQIVLDPFCGNGTIIQELVLLRFKNIIGSDYVAEQIQKTKQNINWLFNNYPDLDLKNFNINIFESDVRKLSEILSPANIDAIITEPFLGSSQLKHFNNQKVQEEILKLENLYLDAFSQFKSLLKPKGKVVIIFPVFKFGSSTYYLNILPQLLKLGFNILDFRNHSKYNKLHLEITDRGSIIYFRPDQIISREIFIFQLKT